MKAGKIWGSTELLHANGVLEFHRIEYKKGGTCSKHLHKYKWNGFYVESGRMKIRVWQKDYDVAFELYWAEFNHDDIQRESVGHLHTGNVVRLDKKEKK
jgi:hypothetical protein